MSGEQGPLFKDPLKQVQNAVIQSAHLPDDAVAYVSVITKVKDENGQTKTWEAIVQTTLGDIRRE